MKTKLQFLYTNGKLYTCSPVSVLYTEDYVQYAYKGPSHSIVHVSVPVLELAAIKTDAVTTFKHRQSTITIFKPKCYSKLFKAGKRFK